MVERSMARVIDDDIERFVTLAKKLSTYQVK